MERRLPNDGLGQVGGDGPQDEPHIGQGLCPLNPKEAQKVLEKPIHQCTVHDMQGDEHQVPTPCIHSYCLVNQPSAGLCKLVKATAVETRSVYEIKERASPHLLEPAREVGYEACFGRGKIQAENQQPQARPKQVGVAKEVA